MPEQVPDFRTMLEVLTGHDVRFVLIGGLALVSHGSAHVTRDLDVTYARDAANIEALAESLAPFHPRLRGAPDDLPFRWDPRTIRSGANFTLKTDLGPIDVLADVAGIDSFKGIWDRAEEKDLFGFNVRVASIDDLISMKQAAGRPQDLRHLAELEQLRRLAAETE